MKTLINIKVDKEIKDQAVKLAQEIGIPLSTAINAFLRQFVEKREVTFSSPFKMSKKLEAIVSKAEKDIKSGDNMSPAFNNAEDALSWLHK
ncbi:MAG: type II toxin-antitoxin system RelB/DinJ family antitoxin [Candidatus Paceibacterota bacterium]|jgi:addiction module RelB/DinJ family antitoxin